MAVMVDDTDHYIVNYLRSKGVKFRIIRRFSPIGNGLGFVALSVRMKMLNKFVDEMCAAGDMMLLRGHRDYQSFSKSAMLAAFFNNDESIYYPFCKIIDSR